ncbi:MAG TPA: hypothetical protein EYH02_02895 [Ignisphaera aggregans]|uniref:Uncharacterized protein n=1 Tax=Ignisphaera aggregans TaxID=334771 RepID=A0A832YZH6_9CREN|nr:hypothetical protein [Ignisphaera aggregans]
MVYEVRSSNELKDFISRHRIALIAFAPKNDNIWRYLEMLLRRFEQRAGYLISFAMADITTTASLLSSEQLRIARKSCLIQLYLDGECVFEQEGVFGNIETDLQVLRHGIKDVLKRRSIKTLF